VTNTHHRIFSALVLMAIVAIVVYLGKIPTLLFCMVAGVLSIDELLNNFSKISRSSSHYLTIQFLFLISFLVLNIFFDLIHTKTLFTFISIFFNGFLIYYLFKIPLQNNFMVNNAKNLPGILSILIIFPLLSIGTHFDTSDWRKILLLLLIVTFSMDTGAWFFGKNFGKHKLWPAVSPNKTIEGLVGGMFTSALLGSFFWQYLFGQFKIENSVIFALCGLVSQVGDLIQSKIKREFAIKDSSSLIPGHGGVYDRIDSLIFLSPFFVLVVKYLRHQVVM
jgi:phosphatidate cytidylyltransferase